MKRLIKNRPDKWIFDALNRRVPFTRIVFIGVDWVPVFGSGRNEPGWEMIFRWRRVEWNGGYKMISLRFLLWYAWIAVFGRRVKEK